jgi:hypothetical protein
MTATVTAVRAAIGFRACRAVYEVAKNVTTAMMETKKTILPMAKFLWLKFSILKRLYK